MLTPYQSTTGRRGNSGANPASPDELLMLPPSCDIDLNANIVPSERDETFDKIKASLDQLYAETEIPRPYSDPGCETVMPKSSNFCHADSFEVANISNMTRVVSETDIVSESDTLLVPERLPSTTSDDLMSTFDPLRETSVADQDYVDTEDDPFEIYESVVEIDTLSLSKDEAVDKSFSLPFRIEKLPCKRSDELASFVEMLISERSNVHDNLGYPRPRCINLQSLFDTSLKVVAHHQGQESHTIVEQVLRSSEVNLLSEHTPPQSHVLGIPGRLEYLLDLQMPMIRLEYVHGCIKTEREVHFDLIPKESMVRPYMRSPHDDEIDRRIKVQDVMPKEMVSVMSYERLKILLDNLLREANFLANSLSNSPRPGPVRCNRFVQSVKACQTLLLGSSNTTDSLTSLCNMLSSLCDSVMSTQDLSLIKSNVVATLDQICGELSTILKVYSTSYRVDFLVNCQGQGQGEAIPASTSSSTDCHKWLAVHVDSLYRFASCSTSLRSKFALTLDELQKSEIFLESCIVHGTRPISRVQRTMPCQIKQLEHVHIDERIEFSRLQIADLPREARLVLTLKVVIRNGQQAQKASTLGWFSVQLFNFKRVFVGSCRAPRFLALYPPSIDSFLPPAPECASDSLTDRSAILLVKFHTTDAILTFPEHVPHLASDVYSIQPRLTSNEQNRLIDICDQDLVSFTQLPSSDRTFVWKNRKAFLSKNSKLFGSYGALPKILLAFPSVWSYRNLPELYSIIDLWPSKPVLMDVLQLLLPCFPDTRVRLRAVEWLDMEPDDALIDVAPQLLEVTKQDTYLDAPVTRWLIRRCLKSVRFCHTLYWMLVQALSLCSPEFEPDTQKDHDRARVRTGRQYARRLSILYRSLQVVCGSQMRLALARERELVRLLHNVAKDVQSTKVDSTRMILMQNAMSQIDQFLADESTPLPLDSAILLTGISIDKCSYFDSNTIPLKVAFNVGPSGQQNVIYKVGDDLRQDALTLQMIKIVDKLWLEDGLDMRIVTFDCLPTGFRHGFIEMVSDAKTLREIQVSTVAGDRGEAEVVSGYLRSESQAASSSVRASSQTVPKTSFYRLLAEYTNSATASFKSNSILSWLERHNSASQLDFVRAVDNFTRSTAGYCVLSYLLGLGDRHNDNIMLKYTGHLFHIDFGKFLGDVQRFGPIRRDRTPFVLTADMLSVIESGVLTSSTAEQVHNFIDLCCRAFNVVRRHSNLLLNLFALMVPSSGIPGLTMEAVRYIQRALMPDLSPSEASATFARLIEESIMGGWANQVNFALHNLAQTKISGKVEGDQSGETADDLLSFIPGVYRMENEGRILKVDVYDIQKRYTPERHYVFILQVKRQTGTSVDANFLFRTYEEFCELDSKLYVEYMRHVLSQTEKCSNNKKIDIEPYFSLQRSSHADLFGRSEVRQVAVQRQIHIARFLENIFGSKDDSLAWLISHPLIYTFFHPLLRDQRETDVHIRKLKESTSYASLLGASESPLSLDPCTHVGELKLSFSVDKRESSLDDDLTGNTLRIMIHHGRNLRLLNKTVAPDEADNLNTYVKMYLMPDSKKVTKRKTKTVKRTCHPSYMEVFEYSAIDPMDGGHKFLQVTVWSSAFADLRRIVTSTPPTEARTLIGAINVSLQQIMSSLSGGERTDVRRAKTWNEGTWFRLTPQIEPFIQHPF